MTYWVVTTDGRNKEEVFTSFSEAVKFRNWMKATGLRSRLTMERVS